jgi:hypothetical protein
MNQLNTINLETFRLAVECSSNHIIITDVQGKIIDSDTVKWQASFSRTVGVNDLKAGSEQMKNDLTAVLTYIKQSGIDEKNVTINPVTVMPVYQQTKDYGTTVRLLLQITCLLLLE